MTEEKQKPKDKKKVEEIKKEIVETPENKVEESKENEKPAEEKKAESKAKPGTEKPKKKKSWAEVNSVSLPISAKDSIALCKFIKRKKITDAINDLELVIRKKKPVKMSGEIPHRKGKGIYSGRFPKNASEYFIMLLKSLSSNAGMNEIEEPVITEAISNLAPRPRGRFGRVRKKRTHVRIVARENKPREKKK